MKHKMTAKQQKFVDQYIKFGNAKQAALEAGYSPKTAKQMGVENLSKPYLKAAIDERMKAIEDDTIAKATEVLEYFTTVLRGTARETVAVATMDGVEQVDNPPSIKDRMAAGRELLKRYPGNDELLNAQLTKIIADIEKTKADVRKSKAEADIMEAKANAYRTPEGQDGGLNKLLAAIDESIPKGGDVNDNSD
ncbi:terminase small subunit [Lacticaseibacillus paracasei subsp. paracasei]|uniref:terminase small subunit n=1 Tax=Lacticaseibacillus paracasei TaxID=1597 RepID=UPI001E31638B|nr:terminase small subunit [Lacticaseibacillus paracasei]MCD0434330.1 terminase small subunit [Lacticaseibacillus paracasei subsp. paracasei]